MLLEKCENIGYFNKTLVGCGKCPACQNNKRNEWGIRLEHELIENGGKGAFITLTYNDENLLKTGTLKMGEGDELGTLNKEDTRNFLKRLRAKISKELEKDRKIKYILAGEYGTAFKRPHYHIILLGLTIEECINLDIEKIWRKGKVDIDRRKIGGGCINYIYNYIKKDSFKTKKDKIEFEKKYNRVAEFIVQSQGIGKIWALKNKDGWTRSMTISNNGHKCSVPRYYIKIIKKLEGKTIKIKRKIIKQYKNYVEETKYTYYKVLENIDGKYTKIIYDNLLKNTSELVNKIHEQKKTDYNFNFMNDELNERITKKYGDYITIKEVKEMLINFTIPKKPKTFEKQKERNKRSIKNKFGNSLNYYLSVSKQYNDTIREKIEATKRSYDVTEKKEYIQRKRKKLLDKIDYISYNIVESLKELFTGRPKKNIIEIGGLIQHEYL